MKDDAAVRLKAAAISSAANQVAEDGLLDVSVLERTRVSLGRKAKDKATPRGLNGIAATDKQFLEWAAERLGMGKGESRLVARLLMVAVIKAARKTGTR